MPRRSSCFSCDVCTTQGCFVLGTYKPLWHQSIIKIHFPWVLFHYSNTENHFPENSSSPNYNVLFQNTNLSKCFLVRRYKWGNSNTCSLQKKSGCLRTNFWSKTWEKLKKSFIELASGIMEFRPYCRSKVSSDKVWSTQLEPRTLGFPTSSSFFLT